MKKDSKKVVKKEIRSNVNKGITKQGEKKSGVIQTILDSIKKKPQTKDSLLKILQSNFPERDLDAMKQTIKAQIGTTTRPTRMEKERGVEFKIETKVVKKEDVIFYSYIGERDYDNEEAED